MLNAILCPTKKDQHNESTVSVKLQVGGGGQQGRAPEYRTDEEKELWNMETWGGIINTGTQQGRSPWHIRVRFRL